MMQSVVVLCVLALWIWNAMQRELYEQDMQKILDIRVGLVDHVLWIILAKITWRIVSIRRKISLRIIRNAIFGCFIVVLALRTSGLFVVDGIRIDESSSEQWEWNSNVVIRNIKLVFVFALLIVADLVYPAVIELSNSYNESTIDKFWKLLLQLESSEFIAQHTLCKISDINRIRLRVLWGMLLSWGFSYFYPLDWDVCWQMFPIPNCIGLWIGIIIGQIHFKLFKVKQYALVK
jgi:hypothetical protein